MITDTSIQIVPRRLTAVEAACLQEELKTTPNILGYTVPELLRFREVLVVEVTDEHGSPSTFAGACLCKDLLWNWTDIAVLYILPEFRGRGLSTPLFTAAVARTLERGRHVYTLSRSPQIIHLMEKLGMELTSAVWKAPLAVHLHMNVHMSSWYRIRESARKAKMRFDDGNHFVGGTKRAGQTGG